MRVYLDIDGVLLSKNGSIPDDGPEFIDFVIADFECYWLTTHCRSGENRALQYLAQYYPAEIIEKLKAVRATNWDALKTEGNQLDNDFWWIDDNPFNAERAILKNFGKENSLILVDLSRLQELKRIMAKLSGR